jgi:hypothetical protein
MAVQPGGHRHVCRVYGHRSDLERVEFLYTSLLVQAVRMASRANPDHIVSPTAAALRSYRTSWLFGFVARIGERMTAARSEAVEEAVRESGQPGAELALLDRTKAAQRALR